MPALVDGHELGARDSLSCGHRVLIRRVVVVRGVDDQSGDGDVLQVAASYPSGSCECVEDEALSLGRNGEYRLADLTDRLRLRWCRLVPLARVPKLP
jgi:hypothetical protein